MRWTYVCVCEGAGYRITRTANAVRMRYGWTRTPNGWKRATDARTWYGNENGATVENRDGYGRMHTDRPTHGWK